MIGGGEMERSRATRRRSSILFAENVIPIRISDTERVEDERPIVFYLHSARQTESLIADLRTIQTVSVTDRNQLRTQLLSLVPQVVVIEADIKWAPALGLIEELHTGFDLPVILLSDKPRSRGRTLIKQAYAAGVSDVLYKPLDPEEVLQSLGVLLKFQELCALSVSP